MIWFLIHNIVQLFPSDNNQKKNLTTFLLGVVIYTILYSWIGTLTYENNKFLFTFFNFFFYIVLADAFSMAVIYKNYYNTTILTEIKDVVVNKCDKNSCKIDDNISLSDELVNELVFPKPGDQS